MFDQTDLQWLQGLAANQTGTGLFLSYESFPGQPVSERKEFFRNITYEQSKIQARQGKYEFFRWIPSSIVSFQNLLGMSCSGGPCPSGICKNPVCFCKDGECIG